MRLLFDLLSSCSGLLKHAAATTRPPSTLPPLTFNPRRTTPPPSKPLLAVPCALRARCRDRPTGVTEPGVLDVVPLCVATGNVRVYF